MFGIWQHNRRTLLKKRLVRTEYAYLFDKPTPKEWVCLDMEMTGLDPKKDAILSLGAVRITQEAHAMVIDTSQVLSLVCRPSVMPDTDNIVVHGLRPIDVVHGVSYQQLLEQLLVFLGSRPIVGFCPNIDMAFLNAIAKPFLGVALANPLIDVSELARKRRQWRTGVPEPKQHLHTLLQEYRIPLLPAHDALNDAIMTAMLFCHLYE